LSRCGAAPYTVAYIDLPIGRVCDGVYRNIGVVVLIYLDLRLVAGVLA